MRFPSPRSIVAFGVFAGCLILAVGQLRAQDEPAAAGAEVPTPVPAADQQYKEVTAALERLKKMDLEGALVMFKDAAAKHPDLPPGEVQMATRFFNARQVRAARYWLEQAVVESPGDPEAYIYIATMALSEGRMCEASLVFAKASALMGKLQNEERKKRLEPRVYGGLAAVAASRKDWQTAQANLEAWLKLEPKSAVALQQLGGVLFQLKKSGLALEKLKEAYAADPTIRQPATQLALLYHQANDQKNAKIWMDWTQTNSPKDLDTQMVVANWCLQTGDLNRAEKLANGAMQLDQNSQQAKILRGVIALYKKDYKNAEVYFEAVVALSPRNFAATNNLALALCEQAGEDKKRLALDYASNNVKLYPKSAEAASTLGWVLYQAGNVRKADEVLTALFRVGKVNEDTAYFIAVVASELGRNEQAISVLESALRSKRPFSKRGDAEALLKELKQ